MSAKIPGTAFFGLSALLLAALTRAGVDPQPVGVAGAVEGRGDLADKFDAVAAVEDAVGVGVDDVARPGFVVVGQRQVVDGDAAEVGAGRLQGVEADPLDPGLGDPEQGIARASGRCEPWP